MTNDISYVEAYDLTFFFKKKRKAQKLIIIIDSIIILNHNVKQI